jgi:hypothetical protein
LTNNVLSKIGIDEMLKYRFEHPNDIIIIHDYDNHHWFKMSLMALIVADLYIPGHNRIPPLFKQILHHKFLHIPVGCIQWSRELLLMNAGKIINCNREVAILGAHSYYPQFPYRNRVVNTFNSKFSEVRFIDSHKEFHNLSEQEKLTKWVNAKLHLIAPVEDDLPIRFFDTLITGGLPLIPLHLHGRIKELLIPDEMYLTYGPLELTDLANSHERWLSKYHKLGEEGSQMRFAFGLNQFHVDAALQKILEFLYNGVRTT